MPPPDHCSTPGSRQRRWRGTVLGALLALMVAGAHAGAAPASSSAPALLSLTLDTSTPLGGQDFHATITLTAPAPAGGAVVTLLPQVVGLTVPATVTIPEGQTSVRATLGMGLLTSPQSGSMAATYNGTTLAAPVLLRPLGVRAVTIDPLPVQGGQQATGHLLTDAPAGPHGAPVALASSDPNIVVTNPTAWVKPGATEATFDILTYPVSVPTGVTLTAGPPDTGTSTVLLVGGLGAPLPSAPGGGPPIYNPSNAHWYQAVRVPNGINWPDARDLAATSAYSGLGGHLATLTSVDEEQFVLDWVLPANGKEDFWLGGYQEPYEEGYYEPYADWHWVTGEPFGGQVFWNPGQPVDSPQTVDALLLDGTSGTHWSNAPQELDSAGCVIEYDRPSGVTPPPAAPSALSLSAFGYRNINLIWTDNSTNEIGFEVYRQTGGGNFYRIAVLGSNETSFTDYRVAGSTTYAYRVRAATDYLVSAFSNPVTITTPAPLAAPTGLSVLGYSYNKVSLAWVDNSTNETAFEVYRKTGAGAYGLVAVLSPNTTSFQDTTVAPATGYTYQVRAANDFYASAYTNAVSVTTVLAPPIAPSGLTANLLGLKVLLSWTDHSNNETAFAIWRQMGGGAFERVGVVAPNRTSFTDTSVSPRTAYTYEVRATNDFYASAWSNQATVTTTAPAPPAAPTGLKVVHAASGKVTLGWTDNSSNEAAFEIWRKAAGGNYVFLSYMPANATGFSDSTVSPATSYTYTIRAINTPLASAFTPGVTVTTMAAPK
jgi:hypothetical protein